MRQHPYNLQIRQNFMKHCKDLKKMIKRKKYLFRKEILDKLLNWKETDPKQYWQMIKLLKKSENRQETIVDFQTEQLEKHIKTQGKPNKINGDFTAKIEDHIKRYKDMLEENDLTDKPFTIKEVKRCVNRLKINKSAGPDLILNEIIKSSNEVTCKSITKLFNLILESGFYPSPWRKSYIILIFKKGDRDDLNNYRGISLQNCLAKLFSSVLNYRLCEHYDNLFADQQFGFRENHRTSDSIFVLKTLITKYLKKNKEKIYACFVDLRRAFDSLWHEGLIYKLMVNKVGNKFLQVVKNMYSLNMSAFKIDNKVSKYFEVERGVKQGDSLSPTLFNCYINDMHRIFEDDSCDPLNLENHKVASLSFADDLVILSNTHMGLQNSLNKLESYCSDWQLTVNVQKTKVMVFQSRYSSFPKFYFNNVSILETKEYNFLGNIIDYKGTFKKTVQELAKKSLKVLFSLKNQFMNFRSIPVNLSTKLFDTLIRPILLYNSEIWLMEDYSTVLNSVSRSVRNGSFCDILALEDRFIFENIHNKFCKSVLGLRKTACNLGAKLELGRMPLSCYIKSQILLYFYRLISKPINPLVKAAFNVNKSLDQEGIYTWYTFTKNILKDLNLEDAGLLNEDKTFQSQKYTLKKKVKILLNDYYKEKMLGKLDSFTEKSKLYLYSKLKTNTRMEKYLLYITNFKTRQLISKFRISDHNLLIETGRYHKIPRDQRKCQTCNILDDEIHFFLHCTKFSNHRNDLLNKIDEINDQFRSYSPTDKFIYILNTENFELWSALGLFLQKSADQQK